MMKFLEKLARIIVRSHISKKELIRPIADYIEGHRYENFTEYLAAHNRELKKSKCPYPAEDIMNKQDIFNLFMKRIGHSDYLISYSDRNKPFMVINSFKRRAPKFFILDNEHAPKRGLPFINEVLATYGSINGNVKFYAKSMKSTYSSTPE